jgi:hypothetical protein
MRYAIAFCCVLAASPAAASVQDMVAREAERKLGKQWVSTAVRLAKIESGFRCNAVGPKTRHGRARGVFQVMPGTARAMGFNPANLHRCDYGVAAGIAHMQRCVASGVRTPAQMASCHVSGFHGWRVRLNGRAESYRRQYVGLMTR